MLLRTQSFNISPRCFVLDEGKLYFIEFSQKVSSSRCREETCWQNVYEDNLKSERFKSIIESNYNCYLIVWARQLTCSFKGWWQSYDSGVLEPRNSEVSSWVTSPAFLFWTLMEVVVVVVVDAASLRWCQLNHLMLVFW